MEKHLMNEIIECLPKGRTKYFYHKDRYALMLLSYQIGQGMTVADLKKSHLKGLLQKPQVKKILAGLSDGFVEARSLENYWADDIKPFLLTLGRWGGYERDWQQTTRRGYNLVVQLNFSNAHDSVYRDLVKPGRDVMLNYGAHPVLKPCRSDIFRETLAWARLDIDFDTNEVLIEEIQSDWVRKAKAMMLDAQKYCDDDNLFSDWWDVEGKASNVIKYVKQELLPYTKMWDEAVLAATIDFVRNELGISRVYYHSFESGPALKCIDGNSPRNLYTKLPKRFCFEKTDESPMFLQNDKRFKRMIRKMAAPLWFRMDLEEGKRNAYVS